MKKHTSLFCIAIILLASIWTPVSAAGAGGAVSEGAQMAFEVTHEIVCECDCGGETQTYQYFPNMSCSRFDGIECEYDDGSTSELEDCTKKAQPIERAAASPLVTAISARPFPYFPTLNETEVLDGAEMDAWLDQISATLFGTTYPGFVLDDHPLTVGQVYSGSTAVGFTPFSFDLTKVDDVEIVNGYVDPDSFEVFDLQFAWVQGTLLAGGNGVTTGHVAVTATYVNDPSWKLTFLLPLGGNYPFSLGSRAAGSAVDFGSTFKSLDDELSFLEQRTDAEAEAVAIESGDACDGCYKTANRDIKRMKRDLKSCLKWAVAGGVVGGLLGLLGGNPGTVIGGAALGAEVVALACADTAATTYGDIITDFCDCLAENDCPPHEVCQPAG